MRKFKETFNVDIKPFQVTSTVCSAITKSPLIGIKVTRYFFLQLWKVMLKQTALLANLQSPSAR